MRRPKPYYKKSHHAWYVNLNGHPKRLASEEEGEGEAYTQYDLLMAGRQPVKDDSPVAGFLERFLDHHKNKSAEASYQFYAHALNSFANYIGPRLRIADLKPFHVYDWIDRNHQTSKRATPKGIIDTGKPTTDNYRRNLIRAVKAVFRVGRTSGIH